MDRILIISDESAPLSPTGDAPQVAHALVQAGHNVDALVLGSGVPCHFPGATVVPWPNRISWPAWQSVRQAIRRHNPDQIFVWGETAGSMALALAVLARCAIKRVVHTATQRGSRSGSGLPGRDRVPVVTEVVRHPRLGKSLLGQSRAAGSGLAVLPWFSIEPPRSVDREEIRRRLGVPPGAALAGTAAPWIPASRLKDFMWAADLLRCIRDDIWWLVIGSGFQDWRLRRYASQLEARDRLILAPWSAEDADIIAGLDVYVQPSDRFDDYGGLRTAITAGIPAIGISRSIHQVLIAHHETGFLVERGARNEIARCVNRLMNEPAIRDEQSRRALEHSRQVLVGVDEAVSVVMGARDVPGIAHSGAGGGGS